MSRRPVDLSVGNSIVAAFAQGRAEALERLRNKQAQDQIAIQNEQQRQAAEEDRRQFEAQLNQQQLQFEANKKLAELGYELNKGKAKIDIEESFRKMIQEGGIPSGMQQETLPYLDEAVRQMPTITGQPAFEQELVKFRRQAGQSELLPETITERNPAAVARAQQVAEQQKEIRKFQLEQQTAEAAQGRTQENEFFKSQIMSAEKKAELDQALLISRENNARALEVARINAAESKGTLSTLAQAYLQNPDLIFDTTIGTPKTRGEAVAELAGLGYNVRSNQQKTVQELAPRTLGLINDILNDKSFTWGLSSLTRYIPGQKGVADEAALDSLKSALTVPEIKFIKGLGAMSDADREFISNLPAKLRHDLDATSAKKELTRLKVIYEKAVKAEIPLINRTQSNTTPGGRRLLEAFDIK